MLLDLANRPVFICVSEMSSSDEEIQSPELGCCSLSSYDCAPMTPIQSEPEEETVRGGRRTPKYKRQ